MIDQEHKARCAFQLHELGVRLLPVHYPVDGHCSCRGAWTCGSPAKHPAVSWKAISTQTEDDVFRILREYPHGNLGISLTGSGLAVLGVDPSGGGSQALAEFEQRRDAPLPATMQVVTGNGGVHLYYRLPDDTGLRGDRMLFLQGVDVITGGLLVVPPSRSCPAASTSSPPRRARHRPSFRMTCSIECADRCAGGSALALTVRCTRPPS